MEQYSTWKPGLRANISSMLRAWTIKTQNIHIIKTEALKYPTAAQNQGHHPEISITSNKNRKTRQFFFYFLMLWSLQSLHNQGQKFHEILCLQLAWKCRRLLAYGLRSTNRNLVFIRRKRREKRVGGFLYFPPHSSILISSETKTELASHTLDYGQASVEDDVYKD